MKKVSCHNSYEHLHWVGCEDQENGAVDRLDSRMTLEARMETFWEDRLDGPTHDRETSLATTSLPASFQNDDAGATARGLGGEYDRDRVRG